MLTQIKAVKYIPPVPSIDTSIIDSQVDQKLTEFENSIIDNSISIIDNNLNSLNTPISANFPDNTEPFVENGVLMFPGDTIPTGYKKINFKEYQTFGNNSDGSYIETLDSTPEMDNFRLTSEGFKSLNYLPVPLNNFETLIFNNKLYIFGGELNKSTYEQTDKIWECDIVNGELQFNWKIFSYLPVPLALGKVARIGTRVYYFGGATSGAPSAETLSNRVIYFNIINGVLNPTVNLSTALPYGFRPEHLICTHNKVMLCTGYRSDAATTYTTTVYTATINPDFSLGAFSITDNGFGVSSYKAWSLLKYKNKYSYLSLIDATSGTYYPSSYKKVHNGNFISTNVLPTIFDTANDAGKGYSNYATFLKLGKINYHIGGSLYNIDSFSSEVNGFTMEDNPKNITKFNLQNPFALGKVIVTESKLYLLGGIFDGANQSDRVIEHDLPNIFGFNSNPKILTYEGNRIISQINIELNDLIDEYNNINYIIKTNQDVDNILTITNS